MLLYVIHETLSYSAASDQMVAVMCQSVKKLTEDQKKTFS